MIYDTKGRLIQLGDTLQSVWGYKVEVIKDERGELTGKLICKPNHSCANINYALNDGEGYTIINR